MAAKASSEEKSAKKTTVPAKKTGASKQQLRGPLHYCAMPPAPVLQFPPEVAANPSRERAIVNAENKWMNRTVLHYGFFKTGPWKVPKEQATVIRKAFKLWQNLPIGIRFVEITKLPEAEIRIGYLPGDGSWSYLGRGILNQPVNERTMSFGWPLDRDAYGLTTAIHEIGHTLGMPHEHQNPFAGIVWDEAAVYKSLGGPPNNWPRETTFRNVLRKINPSEVRGSEWDPDSVMEYEFAAGLIKEPAAYRGGIHPPGTISPLDKTWAKTWYPATEPKPSKTAMPAEPQLRVSEAVTVDVGAGQQVDYEIRVDDTREYTISSFGATDTLLTLFEEVDGEPRFLAGDDDSGTDRTASITYRLRPGRVYHVRLRVVYKGTRGTVTLMYW